MEDVFLGYKREDFSRAQQVAEGLRAEGLTVFFDVAVPVGDHWDDVLEDRVDAVKAVVVLWSQQSRRSFHVRGEAHRAIELKKFAPARIDDCRIPMTFSTVQAANLTGWKLGDFANSEWRRLVTSVNGFVAKAERAAKIKSMSDILALHAENHPTIQRPPHELLEPLREATRQFADVSAAELAALRNAAAKGETWAQYALGLLHLFGDKVALDPETALGNLVRAADRGSSGAYYALGVMLELGIGLAPNVSAASIAYKRASNAGHELGSQSVARLAMWGISAA